MIDRKRSRGRWLAALALASAIVLVGTLAAGASAGAPDGVCASIDKLGLEKQTNVNAARILASCERGEGGFTGYEFSALRQIGATAPDIGGIDRDVTAASGETAPHLTQSETQTWAEGNTTVVTYNDSKTAPSCYSGGSYSQDDGVTWNYLSTRPFCTGHGTGFGDPVVVYDRAHAKWVAIFLASGCGGQGLGVWTSPDGAAWSTGACAHNGSSDDRESGWVDNDPSSPFYGRIYVTWNNFAVGGGALQVAWSNDGALTWSAAVTVNPSFNRNVQVTTGIGGTGTVFIASMNEGTGGVSPRTNLVYRSTNGGATWSPITMGPAFTPPGVANCSTNSYFRGMFSTPTAGYWRYMGWGDIGAGPSGIIHYAYTQDGARR